MKIKFKKKYNYTNIKIKKKYKLHKHQNHQKLCQTHYQVDSSIICLPLNWRKWYFIHMPIFIKVTPQEMLGVP